jgi:hypothetical protein
MVEAVHESELTVRVLVDNSEQSKWTTVVGGGAKATKLKPTIEPSEWQRYHNQTHDTNLHRLAESRNYGQCLISRANAEGKGRLLHTVACSSCGRLTADLVHTRNAGHHCVARAVPTLESK